MSQTDPPILVLTIPYDGITRVLEFDVGIARASDPDLNIDESPPRVYKAIWDTGASGSAISYRVVTELGLKPIDITPVFTASGRREANVYLVDFFFQNDIEDAPIEEEWPPTKRVIDGDITGVDVLIGMDIIGCGDFAVTNYEGRTCVSFRVPSRQKIDFGKEVEGDT